MAGKKAAKKVKSKVEDFSESKKPKVQSLRTEGAASNTYANNEDDNHQRDERNNPDIVDGRAEKSMAQLKWAHQMLLIENKLAALKEQLSRENPPDNVTSFVLRHVVDSLSNLKFPISDKTIAYMHFKDFGQQPLKALYYSLLLSRDRYPPSVITAAVGLEMAKLCGLNRSAASFYIHGGLTFELSKDSVGPNPFIIALLAGRIDVAKLIIEEDKQNSDSYKDEITVSCDTGNVRASWNTIYTMSPLQLISAFGDHEALRYLLSLRFKAKQEVHGNYWTPLHFAAYFGKVENMKVLIDVGKLDVNEKKAHCSSPLHLTLLSTVWRSFNTFSLLLEIGAAVNEPDLKGVTPLHLAAEKDDVRFMEALLARDADVKKFDNNKRSLLHIEAKKGRAKALKALLARGLEINGLCIEKKSPLHYALEGKHYEAAEFLIEMGAEVAMADVKGRTPLNIAIRENSVHIVKLLLANGMQIGVTDSFLVDAAKIGNAEVIEALIAAGASPCPDHKTPPWFTAANSYHKEAFSILLAYSAASLSDLNLILQKQYSEQLLSFGICGGTVMHGNALHWASRMGDVRSASLLMKLGANVNDTNCTRGRIPLHFAAEGNHVALIKFLVSKGADIQAKECYGWSPLHSAAAANSHEAMAVLMELGADLTVKTESGKTPLESYTSYCYRQRDDGIVSLLTAR